MKTCLFKTGEKILELLEEVSHSLGRSSDAFLTSLRALVGPSLVVSQAFRAATIYSPTCFSMGWRMACFLVP